MAGDDNDNSGSGSGNSDTSLEKKCKGILAEYKKII